MIGFCGILSPYTFYECSPSRCGWAGGRPIALGMGFVCNLRGSCEFQVLFLLLVPLRTQPWGV